MDAPVSQNHLLMSCFADFYAEVARIRQAIHQGRLAAYLAEGRAVNFAGASDIAAAVAERLGSRLQQQAAQLRSGGNEAEIKAYRQAQYVMAVLADEVLLLELDWSGALAWRDELLERRLFGSSTAGRDFFQLLDRLLQSRGRSSLLIDLGGVYLLALQLGFKGRYRSRQGEDVLASYKTKLLRFIGWGDVSADDTLMFPHAYQHLVSAGAGERLAPTSRWLTLTGAVLLGYLLISSLVWFYATAHFDQVFGLGGG
jgi:type VI secretion system protein ImpK